MSLFINCPRQLPPQPAQADTLMVFLHGYGADGADLLSLAQFYKPLFPNAIFLSPNAPSRMPHGGYQWFALTDFSQEELWNGVQSAGDVFQNDLDKILETYNIPANRLVLAGFSQGCMLSLYTGLRRKTAPLAILGFSGLMAGGDKALEGVTSKPPVFLAHGDYDTVVPVGCSSHAEQTLKDAGFQTDLCIVAGQGHTIPMEALDRSVAFLKQFA